MSPFDATRIAAAAVARADAASDDSKPPLHLVTAAELLEMRAPVRQMALSPILPLPGLAMLYAPRGVGKTYVALSIAYAMASGSGALGWQAPQPRRVVHIDGEMPVGALQERLAKIVRGAGCAPPADDFLQFLAADLLPAGLPSIARPEVQAAIDAVTDDAEVLILDNLSTLAGGLRENEADDWEPLQRWLMSLRRRGKHALVIHHAGKGGQQRGTSRREDVLDTVIALRRPSDYEAEQGARFEVHLEKARGIVGADTAPFEARLIEAEGGGVTWTVGDLKDAQRDRAKAMLAEGLSVRDVAEETGMSKSAVHRIKKARDSAGGPMSDLLALADRVLSRVGRRESSAGPRSFQHCPTVPVPGSGTAGQSEEDGRNLRLSAVPRPSLHSPQAEHPSRPPGRSVSARGHPAGHAGQLLPAFAEQVAEEVAGRAGVATEGRRLAMVPVDAETLAEWEGELAGLLAAAPGQTITDSERARAYFLAEARRRPADGILAPCSREHANVGPPSLPAIV